MLEEQELLRRCRAGDEAGFAGLFQQYQLKAWRLAYAISGNSALADDITQDAFIQAFRSLGNLQPDAPFGPWFYAIVANRARRTMRRSRWWFPLSWAPAGPDQNAAAALEAVEQQDELWQQIQKLDVDLRTVIGLRYILDMSEAQMARVLGVPQGTVKSRLHRARQALGRELTAETKGAGVTW